MIQILRRRRRALAAATALLFSAQAAAPLLAATARKRLAGRVATRVHGAIRRAIAGTCAVASRSARVDLELTADLLDKNQRMRFEVDGAVRVRVKNPDRRARLAAAVTAGEARKFTTDGGLSFDLRLVPVEVEGQEVTFEVDLDLMVITDQVMQALVRNGVGLAVGIGAGELAESAADAFASMNVELSGGAISLGVDELVHTVSAEAGAIAYSAFKNHEHDDWRAKMKATLSPRGLLRHFLTALLFLGGSKVLKAGLKSAGAAAIGALLPAGGAFVTGLLVTGVWMLVGHRMVHAITVKAPMFWRLGRIHRLYVKSRGRESAATKARLAGKIAKLNEKLAARFLREAEGNYKPFATLRLFTRFFARNYRDRVAAADPRHPPVDLEPYGALIETVVTRLRGEAMAGTEGWYAGRFLAKFLDAIGRAPGDRG